MLQHGRCSNHLIGALRAEADLAVLVRETRRVIGVRADDCAKPRDARDLLLGRVGEMHDDRAVVGARILAHAPLQHVEHDVETEIAIDMDVNLVAGVPVELCASAPVRSGGMIHSPWWPSR